MLKQVVHTGYLKLTLLTQVPSQPSFIAISSWCEAANKTSLQKSLLEKIASMTVLGMLFLPYIRIRSLTCNGKDGSPPTRSENVK